MKRIITNGITNLEPLPGSSEWYWGADLSWSAARRAQSMSRYAQSRDNILADRCITTGGWYC